MEVSDISEITRDSLDHNPTASVQLRVRDSVPGGLEYRPRTQCLPTTKEFIFLPQRIFLINNLISPAYHCIRSLIIH